MNRASRDPPDVETAFAFDYGLARVGVAVGNSLTRGAEPLVVLRATPRAALFDEIGSLLAGWRPSRLVVGRPLHPDGQASELTATCERFARQLRGRFGLPVALVDERFSSAAAASGQMTATPPAGDRWDRARGSSGRGARESLDAEAAAIILRQYWSEQARI